MMSLVKQAEPKSMTFTSHFETVFIRMFSGFKSQWSKSSE
jgi:hypothetical protein